MKSIKNYLNSCLESLLDDDDIFFDPENDKKHVEEWIKDNYKITCKLTISNDFVVNCIGDVTVKNKTIESLTNGLFRWGKVGGSFDCVECRNLMTLKGSPEEVGRNFYCSRCDNLTSLEGVPKEVGRNFYCSDCDNLKTLEGAPERVGGGLYCNGCINLKSLKSAPKKVGDILYCWGCENLTITDSDLKKYKIVQ